MDLILAIIFAITPINRPCYRVIYSSILKEFFHLSQNAHLSGMKTFELRQ